MNKQKPSPITYENITREVYELRPFLNDEVREEMGSEQILLDFQNLEGKNYLKNCQNYENRSDQMKLKTTETGHQFDGLELRR